MESVKTVLPKISPEIFLAFETIVENIRTHLVNMLEPEFFEVPQRVIRDRGTRVENFVLIQRLDGEQQKPCTRVQGLLNAHESGLSEADVRLGVVYKAGQNLFVKGFL